MGGYIGEEDEGSLLGVPPDAPEDEEEPDIAGRGKVIDGPNLSQGTAEARGYKGPLEWDP